MCHDDPALGGPEARMPAPDCRLWSLRFHGASWTRVLTGGSRTRTRVPAEEMRGAPVARRRLQGLAWLVEARASAAHHAV
jgi:hypothetical protein